MVADANPLPSCCAMDVGAKAEFSPGSMDAGAKRLLRFGFMNADARPLHHGIQVAHLWFLGR